MPRTRSNTTIRMTTEELQETKEKMKQYGFTPILKFFRSAAWQIQKKK